MIRTLIRNIIILKLIGVRSQPSQLTKWYPLTILNRMLKEKSFRYREFVYIFRRFISHFDSIARRCWMSFNAFFLFFFSRTWLRLARFSFFLLHYDTLSHLLFYVSSRTGVDAYMFVCVSFKSPQSKRNERNKVCFIYGRVISRACVFILSL